MPLGSITLSYEDGSINLYEDGSCAYDSGDTVLGFTWVNPAIVARIEDVTVQSPQQVYQNIRGGEDPTGLFPIIEANGSPKVDVDYIVTGVTP